MTQQAEIGANKPVLVDLKAGRTYFWCACGRSKRQPFCDGSHKGTGFEPLAFKAEKSEEVLLCACKRTRAAPYCDGSHNALSEDYGAPMDENAKARVVDLADDGGGILRAPLDGGCAVMRPQDAAYGAKRFGPLGLAPLIGPDMGAKHIRQYAGTLEAGETPLLAAPAEVVLFIIDGAGAVTICGQELLFRAGAGIAVKAGEAFRLTNTGASPLRLNLSVCPAEADIAESSDASDGGVGGARVNQMDAAAKEAMGDRYYQVLVDEENQGSAVTQFIGHIPKSRAAHHRHLYEETLTVLSGEGYMWTDETKAPIAPGDTIFLPKKQSHSVECTSEDGMDLVGLFFPSMSPAVNY